MKKFFAFFAMALMFVATSCGNRQAETETEVAADSTAVEVVDTTPIDDDVFVDTVTVETPVEVVAE